MTAAIKTSVKAKNWAKYNDALVNRGSITLWLDDECLKSWEHDNTATKRGRPFIFSDAAVECLLTLRELFRLPYRQTEGLARSLFVLMKLNLRVPDYSSLAKRASGLSIDLAVTKRRGPLDLVLDSTGLKVFGDGEWKARNYGFSKRRIWRKIHLAVNPATQEIEAEILSENYSHDADQAAQLIAETRGRIRNVYGDGCYDKWKVYEAIERRDAHPVIPPRHDAKIKQHGNSHAGTLPRDETIRAIRRSGLSTWKKEVGYHRRSLVETAMFRIKSIFGGKLRNRLLPNQKTEARLRCKILNQMTSLGIPASL